MFIIKRKGNIEPVNFGKIQKRIEWLCSDPYPLNNINVSELAQTVIQSLHDQMYTSDIDAYTAKLSASKSTQNIEYGILAGRIAINNHHKNTRNSFRDKVYLMYMNKDDTGQSCPLVSTEFYKFVDKNQDTLDREIDYNRDYFIDFFGFKTLEDGYLISIKDEIIERPQDLYMRVAIQLYMHSGKDSMKRILQVYNSISNRIYTHATPTLFNSGLTQPQMSSCFLLGVEDSLDGICKCVWDCAKISKLSGGIGIHASSLRGKDSLIRGTNGRTSSIVNILKLINNTACTFNQGSKRKGSFAIYLEPHHPDIIEFLELRKAVGDEKLRARDIFLAFWVSDLFMKRLQANENWSTFSSDVCPNLNTTWGAEYEKLYVQYELDGKAHSCIPARKIWELVFDSQKESGMPYVLYKDTINRSSMQSNLGTIMSSNLCSEITLFSNTEEYAVCTLASICLSRFVEDTSDNPNHEFPVSPTFKFERLAKAVQEVVENLNQVIDRNYYPTVETARSNFRHRPIGIGVQGLADVFLKCRFAFDSEQARVLNKQIFECIYYAALSKSSELCRSIYQEAVATIQSGKSYNVRIFPSRVKLQYPALRRDESKYIYTTLEELPKTVGSYSTYLINGGSPMANKHFHWELCGLTKEDLSGKFDWDTLRHHIDIYGVRNSTLVALMPTASTSQIMGSSMCIEPYQSGVYQRDTLAGNHIVVNKYLMRDFQQLGIWDENMKNYILDNNGSIQNLDIPDSLKLLYKTAWEIKQKTLLEMAKDRQPFVDQSQSMNVFMKDYTIEKFTSMQFYAWKSGLKTGNYYVRTQTAQMAQKFSVNEYDVRNMKKEASIPEQVYVDSNTEICLMCSS